MSSNAPPRRGPSPGLLAALAALLLVLLVVLAAVLGTGDTDGEDVQLSLPGVVATPTPSPTPSVEASARPTPSATPSADPSASADPTATPSPGDGGRPDVAVVVAEDGQVTVLSTADGSAVRVLVEAGALGGVRDVSLSPDRATAYVSAGECPVTTYSVPVAGGEAEELFTGAAPAMSPDGTTIAYAVPATGSPGPEATSCTNALVLRDVDSGEQRTLEPADQGDFPPDSIGELSWAPDSRRLAIQSSFEQSGVGVLDTGAADSLDDQRFLDVDGGDLSSPVWLPDGDRIALLRTCCFPEYDEAPALLALPPGGGGEADAVVEPGVDGAPLAVDASGEHLLVLAGEELLMAPVGGGAPETLASAGLVVQAAW